MEIRLVNIRKSFGEKNVINDVSLVIDSGSFTTLLGASGCGKTTLLRMIAGLETPDTGEIYFGEKCVFSSEKKINIPPEKRELGFVFQDFAKRYPHQLSGGQQQRVAFARAIVIEPECILFDEPLSALDALLREEMRTELKELMTKLNITAVFVTHDQTEAMSMSDKIAVMNAGVVDQYENPEEVYAHPATEYVARFVGSSNWIDKNQMFRPERASLVSLENGKTFDVKVLSTQFLGNAYEGKLKYNNQVWSYVTSSKLKNGENLTLYLDTKDIVRV